MVPMAVITLPESNSGLCDAISFAALTVTSTEVLLPIGTSEQQNNTSN